MITPHYKTVGFELEFFLMDNDKSEIAMVPAWLPRDECGYLVEARGDFHNEPLKAAYLLDAEIHRLQEIIETKGFSMILYDWRKLPAKFMQKAIAEHGKSPTPPQRGSMYGLEYKPSWNLARAGLHVHFGSVREIVADGKVVAKTTEHMDIPKIIRHLDNAYRDVIREAKRLPGLYELKSYGFEYRSLPATVNPKHVAKTIQEL